MKYLICRLFFSKLAMEAIELIDIKSIKCEFSSGYVLIDYFDNWDNCFYQSSIPAPGFNPLAILKAVNRDIEDIFAGDVSRFVKTPVVV
jgi:hypothetical protein